MNLTEPLIIASIASYLGLMAFLFWWARRDVRNQRPMGQAATWLIYMTTFIPVYLLKLVTPEWSRTVGIIILGIWFLISCTIAYQVHHRYNKWLDELQQKQKYER